MNQKCVFGRWFCLRPYCTSFNLSKSPPKNTFLVQTFWGINPRAIPAFVQQINIKEPIQPSWYQYQSLSNGTSTKSLTRYWPTNHNPAVGLTKKSQSFEPRINRRFGRRINRRIEIPRPILDEELILRPILDEELKFFVHFWTKN